MSLSISKNNLIFHGSPLERNVIRTFESAEVIPADDEFEVYKAEYASTDDVYHVNVMAHIETPGSSSAPPKVLFDIVSYAGDDYTYASEIESNDFRFYNDHVSGKQMFHVADILSSGSKIKEVRFAIRSSDSSSYTIPTNTAVSIGISPNQGILDEDEI